MAKKTHKMDDMLKTIEELRTEVRELRDLVNVLVSIVMNRTSPDPDDLLEYDSDFVDMDEIEKDFRFSM